MVDFTYNINATRFGFAKYDSIKERKLLSFGSTLEHDKIKIFILSE